MTHQLTATADKINQECLWEYNFTNAEIIELARHGNKQEKMFLFSKILENATDVLKCLNIFSPRDQHEMVLSYNVPKFNYNFLERRHKILKYFITNEEVDIPELKWEQ
ncbi:hypothetical protein C4565_09535 [Candidatus Parcubacteria bacterium]|jgi:hypothetical protein|nr:MAG: hypothetical protein C4565_09535 [Candidatus Parcubacteria bacterium]